MSHWFACEIEEVLNSAGSRRTRLHRVDRGFALTEGDEGAGFDIRASSEPFDSVGHLLGEELAGGLRIDLPRLPDSISTRILTRVAATSNKNVTRLSRIATITLRSDGLTMITTPDNALADSAFLQKLAERAPACSVNASSLPITWSAGSGAVLLHEAIGHPAERDNFAHAWPEWITVEDVPSSGDLLSLETDDVGLAIAAVDLSEERPRALRRWSHRDVPMRRLTNLVARGSGTPLSKLPEPRIDVLFVSHGSWDPENDTITVRADAADLVEGGRRTPVAPFVFRAARRTLAHRLSGWFGALTRHPGVLCSEEGVQLPVGSAAVGLLTEPE